MSGLKGSVFSGASLAVVPVTNDNPWDSSGLVVTGSGGDRAVFASLEVLDLVGLFVLSVNGANQHVVGDVVKMATVFQPGAGH